MNLRPYQRAILDAILASYRGGVRRQVVSAATGVGKSFVFSQIPSLMRDELPGQILCLVHTHELVEQNAAELRECNPELKVSIEMAERHADPASDIIVASVQTLGRAGTKRRDDFNWDNISICICDECHHSICDAYIRIFEAGG
jgi:superfamily II DNA or RNA helicase